MAVWICAGSVWRFDACQRKDAPSSMSLMVSGKFTAVTDILRHLLAVMRGEPRC